MSSGGTTSTQTSGLDPTMQGILSGFGNAASQAMQQPYNPYMGPMVANLSPLQNQSMQGYSGLMTDPSWQQAQQTYSNAQDPSMNPYLQQVRDTAIADTTKAYNQATQGTRSAFNTPGNFGSARQGIAQDTNDTNLARGLAQGLGGINAAAFDSQQNRMLQGAQGQQGLASAYSNILNNGAQAGNMQRGYDQQLIDANMGQFNEANNYSWDQLNKGAGIFGQLQGAAPRTTTTTGPGADPVAQGMGYWMLGNSLKSGK